MARCWRAPAIVGLNAWAAAWPWFGRRLVTWSSYIVLTQPIPDRLVDIGWTGGEGVADARFTLHYLRTTPDGRIALGVAAAGPGSAGGSAASSPTISAMHSGRRRPAAAVPVLVDVRIEDAWGGPIDISGDHLPWFGSVRGRPIHFMHGYSGNGVGPSVVGGRILAARRSRRTRIPALALPLGERHAPRAFPPEPARFIGARLVREAAARRESMEERGETPVAAARGEPSAAADGLSPRAELNLQATDAARAACSASGNRPERLECGPRKPRTGRPSTRRRSP